MTHIPLSTQFTEKISKTGDLSADNIKYFMVKNPKFARFYLLLKIHKRLHNVPGRPVISNCGFFLYRKKFSFSTFSFATSDT